ncbi:MAG TPA: hypothetical protein VJR27_05460 [Candidatus Saccharimonadales bacterium]|nr:hypothetical protein [Candidatus Saccharimonadales bacterium]
MNKKVLAGVVVVLLVAAVAFVMFKGSKNNDKSATTNTGGSSNSAASTNASGSLTSDSMTPSFTLTANDSSADHEAITVKKGAQVSLTFVVEKSGVYHGGLQFKSTDPALDSGPIAPGDSKTITFSADKTFSFTPYWYASGVKKDYVITVNVN